jgi:hypothetical protein
VQDVAPPDAKVPAAHGAHAAPVGDAVPGGQFVQAAEPAEDEVPGRQLRQAADDLAPVPGKNVPAAQGVQAVRPVLAA